MPGARERVLIVSPVRNEVAHIAAVIRSVAAQRRPPDRWLVIDDGSDDGTLEVLRDYERRLPFMTVLETADLPGDESGPDRLAAAREARAFNLALRQVDRRSYTHVGKLDGDIELPDDWFEQLLDRFRADPGLGLCGGTLVEPNGDGWTRARIPPYHVHGAVKLYTSECFEASGGIRERLAWDTMDEVYARMHGYSTRTFRAPEARHHRPSASAQGTLRGRARHGECAYILHYPVVWALLRSVKLAGQRPLIASGGAYLLGYAAAALRRTARVDDRRFRSFVRRELRGRLIRGSRAAEVRVAPAR